MYHAELLSLAGRRIMKDLLFLLKMVGAGLALTVIGLVTGIVLFPAFLLIPLGFGFISGALLLGVGHMLGIKECTLWLRKWQERMERSKVNREAEYRKYHIK